MRYVWAISDHICAACLGRILVGRFRIGSDGMPNLNAPHTDGVMVARCADCGRLEVGDESVLCCCGATIRGQDAGLECRANTEKTATYPVEIVAGFSGSAKIRRG